MNSFKCSVFAALLAGTVFFGSPALSFAEEQPDWTDLYSCSEIAEMLASLRESQQMLKDLDWGYYNECFLHNDADACAAHAAMATTLLNVATNIAALYLAQQTRC